MCSRNTVVLLALLAAWGLAIASRNVWTPDEPRELALAASQAHRFSALPSLGGIPFAEKPPLAYWVSGAAMRVLGVSGAAARAPLLVYAVIAIIAVFQLGRRLGTTATGVAAALIFSTGGLVFDVQVWLATDALLLAAVTVALLGIHGVFGGKGGGREFWAGCVCLHLGLLAALFAKNFAGWLVPVTTLFAYVVWQRKLRRIWHPAVWLPALGSLALLWFWARCVAASTGGAEQVRALFWDNLAGRLAAYSDPSSAVRVLGHRNWPGKYLVELPVYLLPWTPLIVSASLRMWREWRAGAALSDGARFALSAFLPALVILSCAATSRGIYAAPMMAGVSLFIATTFTSPALGLADAGLRATIRWTAWLVLLIDGGVLAAILGLHVVRGFPEVFAGVAAVAGMALVGWICIAMLRDLRRQRSGGADIAVRRLAGAHLAMLIAAALSIFPLLNRSQDLERIAAFVEEAGQGRPLVLWLPDETTLAMSDLYLRAPACSILLNAETEAARTQHLLRCLDQYPDAAVIGMTSCPPAECDRKIGFTTRGDPLQERRLEFSDAVLTEVGVKSVRGIVRPGGRTYLVGIRDR